MELLKKILILLILLQAWLLAAGIKVYFSTAHKIDRIILNTMEKAKKSIFIASYTFNWQDGCFMLENLAKKGIEVKILLNYLPENCIGIKNLSIKKWDRKSCALHSKFMVIDNKFVFVGSANFTDSSMAWDSNNILFIDDELIGKFFTENFQSLWKNGCILKNSMKTDAIEFYFSPVSDCISIIINEIKKAQNSLKFAIFCFTSDIIGQQIIRQAIKGIKVYGIFEGSQNPLSDEYDVLKKIHLIKVKKDCFVENIHDKFLIVDNTAVITGSFNYTKSATRNIETLIVLRQPEIVLSFIKRWRYLWLWY